MDENREISQDGGSHSKLTRRGFLKVAAGGLGALLVDRALLAVGYPTLLKNTWEVVESGAFTDLRSVDRIRGEIEANHNVSIFNPAEPIIVSSRDQEILGLPKMTVPSLTYYDNLHQVKIIPWDKTRLLLLERVLNTIPASLYDVSAPSFFLAERYVRQSDIGIFPEIMGMKKLNWKGLCICGSLEENERPTVALNKQNVGMTLSEVGESYSHVVHELSHIKTIRNPQLAEDIVGKLGGREILIIKARRYGFITSSEASSFPEHELLNYACGYYILGKDNFADRLDFLGEDSIEVLYNFVKDNFFEGREYN